MNPELRTVTIARDIAEEEAANAYDALSEEVQELRQEMVIERILLPALEHQAEELWISE